MRGSLFDYGMKAPPPILRSHYIKRSGEFFYAGENDCAFSHHFYLYFQYLWFKFIVYMSAL